MTRTASCSCGRLTLQCEGEPVRISVCHCLACQRRTGSAFGAQARYPRERVTGLGGKEYTEIAESGNAVIRRFCPECGSTVWWELAALPGFLSVALGAFGDPGFPAPKISIYEERRHAWVTVEGEVEHIR